jgi:hypothetical protein
VHAIRYDKPVDEAMTLAEVKAIADDPVRRPRMEVGQGSEMTVMSLRSLGSNTTVI